MSTASPRRPQPVSPFVQQLRALKKVLAEFETLLLRIRKTAQSLLVTVVMLAAVPAQLAQCHQHWAAAHQRAAEVHVTSSNPPPASLGT